MTVNINSPASKSHTCVSSGSVSKDLSYSFIWSIFTCFIIFLDSLSVLVSAHQIKQPLLSVSTACHWRGDDPHQSDWPEIPGASEIFVLIQTTVFVFTGSQETRVCQVLSVPETYEIAAHSSTEARKLGVLDIWSNSFSPKGEAGKQSLSPAHSSLNWEEELWLMPAGPFRLHDLPNCCRTLCHTQGPSEC